MTKDKIVQEIAANKSLVRWQIENLGLSGVDFSKVDMTKAVFKHCRLVNASFAGANLHGAKFDRCRFKSNVFADADLRDAHFNKCTGLKASDIAALEQAGAIVENPGSATTPIIGIIGVFIVAAVLFLLGGGWDLFPEKEQPTPEPIALITLTFEEMDLQARQAAEHGEFGKALDLLDKMFVQKPTDVELLLRYAQQLVNAERFADVPEMVVKLLTLQPGDNIKTQARLLLAESLVRSDEQKQGMELYAKLLGQSEGNVSAKRIALMNMGTVLWKINDTDGALKAFKQLLAVSEKDQKAGVWLNIALVHRDAGHEAEEIAAVKKAMSDTNAPAVVLTGAKIHMAQIELRSGHDARAKKLIEEASNEGGDPGQILDALHRLAQDSVKKNEFEEALKIYQLACRILEDDPYAYYNALVHQANVMMKMNRQKDALELYRQVVQNTADPGQKKWAAETVREIESQFAGTE